MIGFLRHSPDCAFKKLSLIRSCRLSQDFETLDLEDFSHNFVNITGLRLVDRDNPVIRDTLQQMQLHQHHTGTKLLNNSKQLVVKVRIVTRSFTSGSRDQWSYTPFTR